jgi:tetratricopeptide (TPR) repeat protein
MGLLSGLRRPTVLSTPFLLLVFFAHSVAMAGLGLKKTTPSEPRAGAPPSTFAAGDTVIVTRVDAPVKSENTVLGTLPKGTLRRVQKTDGDWLWLAGSNGTEVVQGWIHRRDVINAIPGDGVIQHFSDELRASPNGTAYRIRGRQFMLMGQFDKSLSDLDQSLRLDRSNPEAWVERGNVFSRKSEYAKALADYDEALRISPVCAAALCGKASVAWAKGNMDQAIAHYTAAIRAKPKIASTYYSRAAVWAAKRDLDKALADLDASLRLDPAEPFTWFYRAGLWQTKGEYDKALADYNESSKLYCHPKYDKRMRATIWINKGQIAEARSDYLTALDAYKNAIDEDDKLAEGWSGFAWILATCPVDRFRDGTNAISSAEAACILTDWKSYAHIDTFAASHAEAGNFGKAVEWQTKALELAPPDQKPDVAKRLVLYKTGKPYRDKVQTKQ